MVIRGSVATLEEAHRAARGEATLGEAAAILQVSDPPYDQSRHVDSESATHTAPLDHPPFGYRGGQCAARRRCQAITASGVLLRAKISLVCKAIDK